jgi:hypothetical protein
MRRPAPRFALCLDNAGNEASLVVGKIYRALSDPRAAREGLVRVIDESGDDYLFTKGQFVTVRLPQAAQRKLLARSKTA